MDNERDVTINGIPVSMTRAELGGMLTAVKNTPSLMKFFEAWKDVANGMATRWDIPHDAEHIRQQNIGVYHAMLGITENLEQDIESAIDSFGKDDEE